MASAAGYIGKKIRKAFPNDADNQKSSVLMLPVVVGGEIAGYLPPKVVDNGDGTASLAIAGDISLDPGDIEIGAVEIKDHDTDTRVDVQSDGTHNALTIRANVLPLPTGAATETTLAAILAALDQIVDGEVPAGVVDGVNDTFTTADTFKPGTTHLYVNGVRQREGVGFDYVEQVDNQTIVFEAGSIPPNGASLLVDYRIL